MDTGTPKEQKPAIEYTAQAASPVVNSEVKLTIGENSFAATALFDAVEIAFAKVNALDFRDYVVSIRTDDGDYVFSRMGQWAQPFYDAICDAWNKAVLRAFFVSGDPLFKANGDYRFNENGLSFSGKAPVYLYENCIVALPPNEGARRIPLCFLDRMEKGDYELTFCLNTGESYTFSRLGYDNAIFAEAVEKQIRALREKALAAVKEIDPSLTAQQASQLSKTIPEGAAAPMGRLGEIAQSYVTAAEARIANTRAAESYNAFQEICDPSQIWVGFKKTEARAGGDGDDEGQPGIGGILGGLGGGGGMVDMLGGLGGGGGMADMLGGLGGDGGMADMLGGLGGGGPMEALGGIGGESDEGPAPYIVWMIAPSPDGQYAAVEFAEANTATFVYETCGDFPKAAAMLNRALEAISFKREVIRLTDEELLKPENADYYMAAKRTASLKFVREHFTGRVIHSSPEAWKRKLTEMWGGGEPGGAKLSDTMTQPDAAQAKQAEVETPDAAQADAAQMIQAETEAPEAAQTATTGGGFCGQCGSALTPGVKFCGICGAQTN